MDAGSRTRHNLVRRGRQLEQFTIGYNSLEGLVSIVAGLMAGSALLWRLHHDLNAARRDRVERATLRIVGSCFIALAVYILFESASTLTRHEAPERSIPGIIIAAVSLVVMPILAKAKRQIAAWIGSGAM
jgi:hypothetical protein